jgi:hypothetical protein
LQPAPINSERHPTQGYITTKSATTACYGPWTRSRCRAALDTLLLFPTASLKQSWVLKSDSRSARLSSVSGARDLRICVDSRFALSLPLPRTTESPSPHKTPGGSQRRWTEDDEWSPMPAGESTSLQECFNAIPSCESSLMNSKGLCGVCQEHVYDTQRRCRSDDGVVFLCLPPSHTPTCLW